MNEIPRSDSAGEYQSGSEDQRARDRSLRASIAALTRWGHADGVSGTAAARRASLARFLREADPEGVLTERERTLRADRLLRAHCKAMGLKSGQVRRKKKLSVMPSSDDGVAS
jgi:hypothetical protein